MRKVIYFIFALVLFASCDVSDSKTNRVKADIVTCSEYNGNAIEIDTYVQGHHVTLRYTKCKIKEHDYWVRSWITKYGYGSDLKHFESLCDYCSH